MTKSISFGFRPPCSKLWTTSGYVVRGCLVSIWFCTGWGYLVVGCRRPRSNKSRWIFPDFESVCLIRNERDGTVVFKLSEEGWTKKRSGRVKCPACKACNWTQFWESFTETMIKLWIYTRSSLLIQKMIQESQIKCFDNGISSKLRSRTSIAGDCLQYRL